MILISHNLEHVMEVADRAVVLRQGRYVAEAGADRQRKPPQQLRGDDRRLPEQSEKAA